MGKANTMIDRPVFEDATGNIVETGDVLIQCSGHEHDGEDWNTFWIWQMPWNYNGQGIAYREAGKPYEYYNCSASRAYKVLGGENAKRFINLFKEGMSTIRVKGEHNHEYSNAAEIIDAFIEAEAQMRKNRIKLSSPLK